MSDYMFMLENHLTADQARILAEVQAISSSLAMNLFLSGGAVRDMIAGAPIRDLDFTVEGDAQKFAKQLAKQTGGDIETTDLLRKRFGIRFPSGITAEVRMSRTEKFGKPGSKPQVAAAPIYEDLRGRDFTINALALSLNKASRGLFLDPTNGLSDLERRELRACGNYTLYDEPIRIFRLVRFRVRLSFTIAERTQAQYENAREADVLKYITPKALLEEFEHIAQEPNAGEILQALDQEKLLEFVMPGLGGKINLAGFAKLQKARQMLPFGIDAHYDPEPLFFYLMTEKMTPKDRSALVKALAIEKEQVDAYSKLDAKAKKAEKEIQAATLQKPSVAYRVMSKIPGEVLLLLSIRSQQRVVIDRIRNYYQKYLPAAHEVTDAEVVAKGAEPGTAKFAKLKEQMISSRLDARPKKVPVPEPVPAPPPVPAPGQRHIARG